MNSAMQPQGVFFMFGGCSFIAIFYVWYFIRESKGLTDFEKKTLFAPDGWTKEDDNDDAANPVKVEAVHSDSMVE